METYSRATTPRPPIRARGRLRCGSFTSPATYVISFQPLYAHKAAIIAAPKPATPPRAALDTPSQLPNMPDWAKCPQSPRPNKKGAAARPAMSTTFIDVSTDRMRPPNDTAPELM